MCSGGLDVPHTKKGEFETSLFQTLYIPHGWSYVINNLDDTLSITELKLTDGGLELATAALPESQIHVMKKDLQEKDLVRPLWRRFTEILKQRRSPGKYGG